MTRPPFHPQTASITEGFDPALSVMAARPPIYPVSTFVFQSAETISSAGREPPVTATAT